MFDMITIDFDWLINENDNERGIISSLFSLPFRQYS